MKQWLIFIFIFFIISCSYDKNERPGFLDPFRYIIWTNRIVITTDYYIDRYDYLYIDCGTKIILKSSVPLNIIISGSVKMFSTKTKPIIFSNTSPTISNFILEENSHSNIIQYCDFGMNKVSMYQVSSITQCKIKLLELYNNGNSIIKHNDIGLLKIYNQSSPTIQLNIFDRAFFLPPEPSFNSYKIMEFNGTGNIIIIHNNFVGNSDLSKPATNYIIFDYSSGNLNFQNNYWYTNNVTYIKTTLLFTNTTGYNSLIPSETEQSAGCDW